MKVVLDTGVVLSALVFPAGRLDWLVRAWREGTIVPLVSAETTSELIRALAYPKFRLDAEEIQTLLGAYLPWTEAVTPGKAQGLPRCRDPEDQKFLELAAAGQADLLVASDHALLALAASAPFPILTPAELRARLRL